jgi:hypothetical protein
VTEQISPEAGYEVRDVNVRGVAWFGLGLTGALLIICAATAGLFFFLKHPRSSPDAPSHIVRPHPIAPEPSLQTDPSADLAAYRIREEAKLDRYEWIDRDAGIVRIPIARAIDLIAERGLPVRGQGTPDSSGKTPEQMRQERATTPTP